MIRPSERPPPLPPAPSAGMALVLASGLLSLLVFSCAVFLRLAHVASLPARARLSAAGANLAAESGLHYAAARLALEGYPRRNATFAGRADDWIPHDAPDAPPSAPLLNPSYSHGEPWTDDGDGAYEPGEPFVDMDADGRFSARTSRLRSGTGPLRFSLRIESTEAKIPLNGGFLDDLDRNGNGVPDHRDTAIPAHRGLMRALDNLGALLRPEGAGAWTRRADVPAGDPVVLDGDPIRAAWLGFDLLIHRPRGGYRTWADVETVLANVSLLNPPPHNGGGSYAPEEIALFRPFLDVGPDAGGTAFGPPALADAASPVPMRLVNLPAAHRETLAALWMYLTAQVVNPLGDPGGNRWGDEYYSRSGASNLNFDETAPGARMMILIGPEEAESLADALLDLVEETPPPSWPRLYEKIIEEADAIFEMDYADLEGAGLYNEAAAWTHAKADLAVGALSPDPTFHWGVPCAWTTRGTMFDMAFAGIPSRPMATVIWPHPAGVSHPDFFGGPWAPDANAPYVWGEGAGWAAPPRLEPLRGTLAPPTVYDVASAGTASAGGNASVRLRARLAPTERVEFTSQEDFENLDGSAALRARGILADGEGIRPAFPEAIPDADDPDAPGFQRPPRPFVASLPRLSARRPGAAPFSRFHGALALAGRECDRQGADLYWPFSQDLTPADGLQFPSDPPGNAIAVVPSDDAGGTTPLWVSNVSTPLLFDCPGIRDADTNSEFIEAMTVEAWLVPGGDDPASIEIAAGDWPESFFRLTAARGVGETNEPGTFFRLEAAWMNADGITPAFTDPPEAFAPDFRDDDSLVRAGFHHAVLTLEWDPDGGCTWFRLFVDGENLIGGVGGVPFPDEAGGGEDGQMRLSVTERLTVHRAGEIRLYAKRLLEDADHHDALNRFALGRFVRPLGPPAADPRAAPANPTYLSPRYDLGGPARLRRAQWTGFSSQETDAAARLRAVVYGFDASGAPAGPPIPLDDPEAVASLDALGTVHAFSYAVEFHAPPGVPAPPPPLLDTPVFESIWFTLQRRARGWAAWETE